MRGTRAHPAAATATVFLLVVEAGALSVADESTTTTTTLRPPDITEEPPTLFRGFHAARDCTPVPYNDSSIHYWSENGQERWLDEHVFRGRPNVTFLEFGTASGTWGSNMVSFEQSYCWRGLCVEPFRETFQQTTRDRGAACHTFQGAVCATAEPLEYLRVESSDPKYSGFNTWSGLTSTMTDFSRARIAKTVQESQGLMTTHLEQIRCYTIEGLLSEQGVDHVDVVSMDCEGCEYHVLSSIRDWTRMGRITVWIIENSDERIRPLMEAHGYEMRAVVGADEIYVRRGLAATSDTAVVEVP